MEKVSFKVAKAIKETGYEKFSMTDESYPNYFEVWLWLWDKGICIEIKNNHYYTLAKVNNQRFHEDTPEKAIIVAIEYLVDNDLIK